ncbi:MAG: Ankyrin repeat-containing protein AKR1 [candidate division TM6 bacterium GW2011_GWF2_30_66]|jgi:ankyrin repeat protein|nr:MAG: Ankyrin repeat-containing protein AKR1 [candidate division TM6 bacterium GW2011_GWF2_30_66]
MCKNFLKNSIKLFVMACLFINFSYFAQSNVFDLIDKGSISEVKPFLRKINKNMKIENNGGDNSFSVGESLLNAACYKNDLKLVKAIVESLPGSSLDKFINEVGIDGETPLSCACYKDNFELVKYLIGKGAIKSINLVNIYSQSPLYWACWNNNLNMVKYLIKKSAYIDQSCLDIAEDKPELLEFLNIMKDLVGFVRREKKMTGNLKKEKNR